MRELEYSVKEIFKERGGRVLFFVPHPDDIAIMLGGALKRAVDTVGADNVDVVVATNGEKGQNRLPQNEDFDEDFVIKGGRRQEEIESLMALGVNENNISFLSLPDGEVDEMECQYWLEDHIDEYGTIVTLGPTNDGHPDHSAVHRGVLAARRERGLTRNDVAVLALNAHHNGQYVEDEVAAKFAAASRHLSQYPPGSGWLLQEDGEWTMGPNFAKASSFYPPLAQRETYDLL